MTKKPGNREVVARFPITMVGDELRRAKGRPERLKYTAAVEQGGNLGR
jgi:hypothetical protein